MPHPDSQAAKVGEGFGLAVERGALDFRSISLDLDRGNDAKPPEMRDVVEAMSAADIKMMGVPVPAVHFILVMCLGTPMYFAAEKWPTDDGALVVDGLAIPHLAQSMTMTAFGALVVLDLIAWMWAAASHGNSREPLLFLSLIATHTFTFLSYHRMSTGIGPVLLAASGRRIILMRYVSWFITTASMMLLYGIMSAIARRDIAKMFVINLAALISGFLALYMPAPLNAVFLWVSAYCFYSNFYSLIRIISLILNAGAASDDNTRGVSYVAPRIVALLSCAPVCPVLWLMSSFGLISVMTEDLLYDVSDLISKAAPTCILMWYLTTMHNQRKSRNFKKLLDEQMAKTHAAGQKADADFSKLKDDFIDGISHDLRMPITGMIGLIDTVLNGACGEISKGVAHRLETTRKSGKQLADLINDVLLLSTIGQNRFDLCESSCNFTKLCAKIGSDFATSQKKGVKFELDIAPELPQIRADGKHIEQMLKALLDNAARHTDQGVITLAVRLDDIGQNCLFIVSDTGPGVPASEVEEIWKPFSKGSNGCAEDQSKSGSGLGLTIARKMAEAHGGTLVLEPPIPGQGAVFTASIPALISSLSPRFRARPGRPIDAVCGSPGVCDFRSDVPCHQQMGIISDAAARLRFSEAPHGRKFSHSMSVDKMVLLPENSMDGAQNRRSKRQQVMSDEGVLRYPEQGRGRDMRTQGDSRAGPFEQSVVLQRVRSPKILRSRKVRRENGNGKMHTTSSMDKSMTWDLFTESSQTHRESDREGRRSSSFSVNDSKGEGLKRRSGGGSSCASLIAQERWLGCSASSRSLASPLFSEDEENGHSARSCRSSEDISLLKNAQGRICVLGNDEVFKGSNLINVPALELEVIACVGSTQNFPPDLEVGLAAWNISITWIDDYSVDLPKEKSTSAEVLLLMTVSDIEDIEQARAVRRGLPHLPILAFLPPTMQDTDIAQLLELSLLDSVLSTAGPGEISARLLSLGNRCKDQKQLVFPVHLSSAWAGPGGRHSRELIRDEMRFFEQQVLIDDLKHREARVAEIESRLAEQEASLLQRSQHLSDNHSQESPQNNPALSRNSLIGDDRALSEPTTSQAMSLAETEAFTLDAFWEKRIESEKLTELQKWMLVRLGCEWGPGDPASSGWWSEVRMLLHHLGLEQYTSNLDAVEIFSFRDLSFMSDADLLAAGVKCSCPRKIMLKAAKCLDEMSSLLTSPASPLH